ncbi:hypothetical protein PHISCL_00090 [Aspergillus sclerotialis]|uniref:C3HC zinc finger domain protein n=1 Tax=Aspergillus sclerotialis TaxID=2070753 RepID=A0A3A3A710_9EURO|nr:hypothetical protein PHISCL_00090 [Aspergillus sclerotialis]
MSYALETKKRKFHRILDSLSKPSQSPEPSKSAATAPATRERMANLSIKKVRLSDGDDELSSVRNSILKINRPDSRVVSTSSTSRPSFVPWDRERFLERLETFRRVDRWSPKPSGVNEVAWAKRGWICTDVSRVTCVGGCGGSVVVKLPDELDELDGYDAEKVQERKEVRAKLVEEYARLLTEGHVENCPWKTRGCDATIHRLPVANPDTAITGLQKRYMNLVKMGDKLPANDITRTPESLDLEEMIKILPPDFQNQEQLPFSRESERTRPTAEGEETQEQPQPEQPEQPINQTAFALAFFGWDTTLDEAAGLAGCRACFRRLGLWMYKPKENGAAPVYDALEVANEHMEYCPWVNGQAQSGTGKALDKHHELRSGWELLAQGLKVKHRRRMRMSMSRETSRAVSEVSSQDGPVPSEVDSESKKASDREWFAKIRRMRQMLHVKSPKRKSTGPGVSG